MNKKNKTDEVLDAIFKKERELYASDRAISIANLLLSPECYYEILSSLGYCPAVSFVGEPKKIFDYPVAIKYGQTEDITFEIFDPWGGFDLNTPEGRRDQMVSKVWTMIEAGELNALRYSSRRSQEFFYTDEAPRLVGTTIDPNSFVSFGRVTATWNGGWEVK